MEDGTQEIAEAVAALGPGPLTEVGIAAHLRPLFSRTLADGRNYLANHTLGRPLDRMQADLQEGADLWARLLRAAWEPWLAEEQAYRAALAGLLGIERMDCVIPKASAGQALRSVLNTLPQEATVLTTYGEFASVAVVLAQYAALGRIKVRFASPAKDGRWTPDLISEEVARSPDHVWLVVISQVFFGDALLFDSIPALARACRARGSGLLVDCYHALGVIPVHMGDLGCDYLIGGCYKYLRGGPGAAFLAITPEKTSLVPLDIGWFAQVPGTDSWQEHGPVRYPGGDGWLDGTPPVLTYYQARSGLAFTRVVGVERLRAYSLGQLQYLRGLLAEHGMESVGGDTEHGAFLTMAAPRAAELVRVLAQQGIVVDERGGRVRICPDCLTTRAELEQVAAALKQYRSQSGSPESSARNSAGTSR